MNTRVVVRVIFVAFLFFSCRKKEALPNETLSTNIYISGTDSLGAVYWKNGVPNRCASSNLAKMVVNGNDVYFPNGTGYWKNGIQINVAGASSIKEIFIDKDDVYAVGYTDQTPSSNMYYWKNDRLINLPVNAQARGEALGIATSGSDVYVACQASNAYMAYWKNDSFYVSGSRGFIQGMEVAGSDVYLYGLTLIGPNPVYVRNGNETIINIPNYDSFQYINDLALYKGNAYFTVSAVPNFYKDPGKDPPLYWKNEQGVGIGLLDGYTTPASIAVDNGDVYVVGNQAVPSADSSGIGSYNIIVWKNGIEEAVIHNAKAQKIIVSH